MLSSAVFSYTERYQWICREAESYTLDSDGKSNLYFCSSHIFAIKLKSCPSGIGAEEKEIKKKKKTSATFYNCLRTAQLTRNRNK